MCRCASLSRSFGVHLKRTLKALAYGTGLELESMSINGGSCSEHHIRLVPMHVLAFAYHQPCRE